MERTAPSEVHCLACRGRKPFVNGVLKDVSFVSKRKGVPMNRKVWEGMCGSCNRRIKQFTKNAVPEPSPTPEPGE